MSARRSDEASASDAGADAQRVDKWLWCARQFKTRSLASKVANAGALRLTRGDATVRIEKASFLVRPGDVLSFMRGDALRILCIEAIGFAAGRPKRRVASMMTVHRLLNARHARPRPPSPSPATRARVVPQKKSDARWTS